MPTLTMPKNIWLEAPHPGRRSIVIGVGVLIAVLLLIAITAAFTYTYSVRLRESQGLVFRAYQVREAAHALLSYIQDAETGQRGFLLTESRQYLEPYERGRVEAQQMLATLKNRIADNPAQQVRLAMLEQLVAEKLGELEGTVDLATRENFAAARQIVVTDIGRALMDKVRDMIAAMLDEEERLLNQHRAERSANQDATLAAATAGLVLAFVAVLLAGGVLLRNYRRLQLARAELAGHAALLQATLDNTHEGIAAFGPSGALVAWNERFFEIGEFPATMRARGHRLDFFVTFDRARADSLFENDPERPGVARVRARTIIGARRLECFQNWIPEGGVVVTCVDVTERDQSEEIIRQAQKLEAVGQLTGGVAHDFNNLLQVIGSNIRLASNFVGDRPDAMRRLDQALSGVDRAAGLTRQLLAFARRQPLEPRIINLGRFVTGTAELLRRTLGETIEIETVIGGGLWNTLADPVQVETALLNLCVNARDAMPEGGKLTVEIANASLDEAYTSRHRLDIVPGQYVVLSVTDTGHGMSAETIARAFEPFFTTKPVGQGTGLGLSQVYGFVKQSQGHIKIYSEVGHGTTIKMYLPRAHGIAEDVQPDERRTIGGTETVLVVEDNPDVREATVAMVKDLGYRVLEAGDTERARAILSAGTPIDLLFCDVVMPGPLKTRELARQAQAQRPDLAVVFTSGYTENAVIHHGRIDADVHFLSKPFTKEDLARKFRRALEMRPRMASAATSAADTTGANSVMRVLLVEDEPLIALATADMLTELGHKVHSVASARDALHWIETNDIDLLLTDINLPDLKGWDLATRARALRPMLKIVVVTGMDGSTVTLDQLPNGTLMLNKPYMPDELRRVLLQAYST